MYNITTIIFSLTSHYLLLGLPPLHLKVEAEAKAGNFKLRCNEQWKPKSEGSGHAYMTQDMKKGPIRYRDMCMINHSQSDSLIEVNGKWGFSPTERGD
jgi:hypothetical protein